MTVDLQLAIDDASDLPDAQDFDRWVEKTLKAIDIAAEVVTLRVVETEEMVDLNFRYRGKQAPTNVLSFPFEQIEGVDYQYLGDIVLCAPVVKKEAKAQEKAVLAHCAHLTIHGTLHLCGFDHICDRDASKMEGFEKSIMADLGFTNPYDVTEIAQ